MATSHGSPPPGTCHTEILSGEYVYLPEHQGPTMNQEVGGMGQTTKGKATSKGRAKPTTVHMPTANICWPAANLLELTLII